MNDDAKQPSAGNPILKPITIDMERLFVAPELNDTTRIAALLANCAAPVRLGVLDVPRKLLDFIEEKGRQSEALLPMEAVEVYRNVWVLENRMLHPDFNSGIDDAVRLFTYDAVKSADGLVDRFTGLTGDFCREILAIREEVASESSFFMSRTLGTDVTVDPTLIVTAARNFFQSLNVLASGMDGYIILALVKIVDAVGKLLDDPKIQALHAVSNQTALMNKLGFRILPGHAALHNHMRGMFDLIFRIDEGLGFEKDDLVKIFSLADQMEKGLGLLEKPKSAPGPGPARRPPGIAGIGEMPRLRIYHAPPDSPRAQLQAPETVQPGKGAPALLDANAVKEMIRKNVIVRHPRFTDGIGQIIDVLRGNSEIAKDRLKRYYGDAARNKPDASATSDRDRVVIEMSTGEYVVIPIDGDFHNHVTIV